MADLNGDGRLDVVVTALGGAAAIWRNTTVGTNSWVAVPAPLNGAVVLGSQTNLASSSVGYSSSVVGPVHFGLGAATGPVTGTVLVGGQAPANWTGRARSIWVRAGFFASAWGLRGAPADGSIRDVKELGAVGTMGWPRFRRRFGFALANLVVARFYAGFVGVFLLPLLRVASRLGYTPVVWVTGRNLSGACPACPRWGYAAIGFALANSLS